MIEPDKLIGYFRGACDDILARGTIDASGKFLLRPGQRQGYEVFASYLDRTDLSKAEKLEGFFTMSVGLGKTGFFGALIDNVRQKALADGKNLQVAIIAPTIELLDQTQTDFEKFFPALKGQVGIYGGNWPNTNIPRRETDKPITNISFPSWEARVDQGELNSNTVDILITDEGHRGTSVAREKRLLGNFREAAHYAFQATPHFDKDKTVYNTHKREIFRKDLVASVRDGESAAYIRAQHHIIRVVPKPGEPFDARLAKQQAFNKFVKSVLRTGMDEVTGERFGFDEVTGDRLTDNQIGIYTGDTTQADRCARDLNSDPILQSVARQYGCPEFAVSVHTIGMNRDRQRALKESYETGLRRSLVGDELFKEGYNHPPMKVVIVYPTGSRLDLEQIIGRGARNYWNEEKNRFEGLTAISTTIYIGCDPADSRDVEEVKRAQKADAAARKKALADTISAIDILGGNIEVLGPSTIRRVESHHGGGGGHKLPIDVQFESYTSMEGMRTIHAERDRIRTSEPMVDWTDPKNRAAFEKLRAIKGKPGGAVIYNRLPKEAKDSDANYEILFESPSAVQNVLSLVVEKVSERQLRVLMQTLESMEDMVKWSSRPKNRKPFEDLWTRKGKPAEKTVQDLLLRESAISEPNGKPLFSSKSEIRNIITGTMKWVEKRQIQGLMQLLEKMDDMIEWKEKSENRAAFDELRQRKGNPRSITLFSLLPESVKVPNANGEILISSHQVVETIVVGRLERVSTRRLQVLMETMEGMDNAINGAKPEGRAAFDELWIKKGRPGYKTLFKLLPAEVKTPDANGEVLFTSPYVLEGILSGEKKVVTERRIHAVTQLLETMSDVVEWGINSKGWKTFDGLRTRKGKVCDEVIYRLLPEETKISGANGEILFTSASVIGNIIQGNVDQIPERQLQAVTQVLERMDNKVEWRDNPKNRVTFEERLAKKGKIGAQKLFKFLPEEAKTPDANGKVLFSSHQLLAKIMNATKEYITEDQLQVVMQAMEAVPNASEVRLGKENAPSLPSLRVKESKRTLLHRHKLEPA